MMCGMSLSRNCIVLQRVLDRRRYLAVLPLVKHFGLKSKGKAAAKSVACPRRLLQAALEE